MRRMLMAVSVFLAACATPEVVVRQGEGWREVQAGSGTAVQVTATDQKTLGVLATTHADARVRAQASERLTDPAALSQVARRESDVSIRKAAVARVLDPELLGEIGRTDADPSVRQAAAERAEVLIPLEARHPEYKYWSNSRTGSWVALSGEVKSGSSRTPVQLTRRLVGTWGEKIILEQEVAPKGQALKSMLAHAGSLQGRRDEGSEDVEIAGRRIPCRWARQVVQRDDVIIRCRVWLNDGIPGGLARLEIEESPEGRPLRTLLASATQWQR